MVESAPHPSSTVLVLRDAVAGPEVLMVRRQEGAAFMGGAHVFPGGRVDAGDHDERYREHCDGIEDARRQLSDLDPAAAVAWHVAAARELFEEAGLLLARDARGAFVALASDADHARFARHRRDVHAGTRRFADVLEDERLRLALDALVLCAHWVTPPLGSRRFDTRFFVTVIPPAQIPAHDEAETTHSVWMTAARAIAAARRGDIVLPPPTWMTLSELEPFQTADQILRAVRRRSVVRREPTLVQADGVKMLVMPGGAARGLGNDTPFETCFVWTDGKWMPTMSETA